MTWSPDAVGEALVRGVTLWNLYGLPALLLAVACATLARPRARTPAGRGGVVRRLGLVHYGLAAWSLTTVVSELWAARAMGVLPSNPVTGLVGSTLALAIDAALGLGLRAGRPGARWSAVVVWSFRAAWSAWVAAFLSRYRAPIDLAEWPRLALSWALPPFALFALLLPATGRAFRSRGARRDESAGRSVRQESDVNAETGFGGDAAAAPGPFDVALALGARLLVVVAASVALTDAADWAVRAAAEAYASGVPAP